MRGMTKSDQKYKVLFFLQFAPFAAIVALRFAIFRITDDCALDRVAALLMVTMIVMHFRHFGRLIP